MGLEEVKEDILKKANEESGNIKREVDKTIKIIWADAKKQIEEMKRKSEEEAKQELGRLREMRESEAKAEAMNMVLRKKAELIDKAIEEAKKDLGKNKKKYVDEILKKIQAELEIDKIYCDNESAKSVKGYNISKSKVEGIVVENKDASITVDFSFDSILAQIKEKNLQEIAKVLFK